MAASAVALVAALALLPACGKPEAPPVPERAARRPHVLVLVMDTTRADRSSVDGYDRPTTPRLEALAREGVLFRECWSPCSWTGPAHASLFTGLLPQQHGFSLGIRGYLNEDATTLAEVLAGAGYRTACFSNNHFVAPDFGVTQGFDTFVPLYTRAPRTESYAARGHEEALRWALDVHRRGERFFLFINDIEPHLPYTPPEEFQRRFVPAETAPADLAAARAFENTPHDMGYSVGAFDLPADRLALLRSLYDAEVATLDDAVGTLIERLREECILDETVVVIAGDHGEMLGEQHMIGHQFGMYRPLLRVPLVLRFPGAFEGGRTEEDLVRLEDVFPTCLELCGLAVPPGLHAQSLRRNLPGRIAIGALGAPQGLDDVQRAWPDADIDRVASRTLSVYDGRHHGLLFADGRRELYDLSTDPQEARDLSRERPEILWQFEEILRGL